MTNGRKTQMRWHLEGWEDLELPQLRQKLLERMGNSEAVQRRFWKKVMITPDPYGCQNWNGAKTAFGYGVLTAEVGSKRVNLSAHRIAYFIKHKSLPQDALVCHTCDNPACVNPDHLFLGSNRDNQLDKVQKDRQAFSEEHGRHILTCDQVQQIRVLHFFLKTSSSDLANLFNMGNAAIDSILDGKNWKHLPVPRCISESPEYY